MTAARWAVGVDVGGTRTKIGAISPAGALAVPHSLPTPTEPGDLAALIGREVDSLGRHLDLPEGSPVGVVVPGILDEAEEQIERAVNLGWTDIPFGRMLREHVHAPLAFGHDVRAGALAEAAWGVGRTLRPQPDAPDSLPPLTDLIFVPIGTGVAASVIHDGAILGDRYTGEIGQVTVTEPYTGQTMRLEEVASASAIARRYARLTGSAAPTAAAEGGRLAAREAVDRARAGDPQAEQILFSALDTLAQAIATVISGIGTLPVVIGGGLAEGGDIVLDPLRAAIAQRLGVVPSPPVLPSSLGMWAGCHGAGLLAMTRTVAEDEGRPS